MICRKKFWLNKCPRTVDYNIPHRHRFRSVSMIFVFLLDISIICIIINNTDDTYKREAMRVIISLDMSSTVPIYVQLRNQIVTGIGRGELKAGETLPSVRQMAQDAGVNSMTVNKTYQILKTEGFIEIDRRKGATVCPVQHAEERFREKLEAELELLSAEASLKGMDKKEFLRICEEMFQTMHPAGSEA